MWSLEGVRCAYTGGAGHERGQDWVSATSLAAPGFASRPERCCLHAVTLARANAEDSRVCFFRHYWPFFNLYDRPNGMMNDAQPAQSRLRGSESESAARARDRSWDSNDPDSTRSLHCAGSAERRLYRWRCQDGSTHSGGGGDSRRSLGQFGSNSRASLAMKPFLLD